ncbi:hypothetical protein D2U88_07230 [Flagellimonas aequoris]|uniref:Outer membrane protein beta-barrel domain-containing protein n=2 Tax=Flagellimonas aequoris TaxID=2306997 RepID=A0A418N8D7_9FLAO|nr:hypothetical protein D2U88_07230 [Allomuricauda aequoris]
MLDAIQVYHEGNQVYVKISDKGVSTTESWVPVKFQWKVCGTAKFFVMLMVMFTSIGCFSQNMMPKSISVSYLGEMVTHPGLKLTFDYPLTEWEKSKSGRRGGERRIEKSIELSPTVGFYYHRRYQSGVMAIPELKFKRQNPKGNYFEIGAGLGYLRTIVPNTYEVDATGEVSKTHAGHNYWAKNLFVTFGRELKSHRGWPMGIFVKPQFLYATPNFPKGVGYFMLELGINVKLK